MSKPQVAQAYNYLSRCTLAIHQGMVLRFLGLQAVAVDAQIHDGLVHFLSDVVLEG